MPATRCSFPVRASIAWIHPPYYKQKLYTKDPSALPRPTLEAFLDRYRLLIENCAGSLVPGGKLAILWGTTATAMPGFCL